MKLNSKISPNAPVHPRQPLTGDLKMHFRFGVRMFYAASNLTSKWTPCSYFRREFRLLLTNFFVVGMEKQSGKGIHKNLQTNSK